MLCFVHAGAEARGICKVCGRGLCGDCAADLGHSLACRDRHEGQAEAVFQSIQSSFKLQSTAKRSVYIAPLFFGFMGLVFAVAGLFDRGAPKIFTLSLGAGFVVFAVVALVVNRRAYGPRSVSARDNGSAGDQSGPGMPP